MYKSKRGRILGLWCFNKEKFTYLDVPVSIILFLILQFEKFRPLDYLLSLIESGLFGLEGQTFRGKN